MSRQGTAIATFKLTRAGQSAPPIETVVARSRPFAAAAGQLPYVVLLALRTELGVEDYLLAPDLPAAANAVNALASAVGARAEPAEPPDLTSTTALVGVEAAPSRDPSRNTQAGADPTELAALFARSAAPGQWVAFSLRKPTGAEASRSRRWWSHRLQGAQTHYHLDPTALISSVVAGERPPGLGGRRELAGLVEQVVSALPGFDLETRVRPLGHAAQAALATVFFGVVAGFLVSSRLHHTLLGAVVGLACTAVGLAFVTGAIGGPGVNPAKRLRAYGVAAISPPPRLVVPPRGPGQRKRPDGSVREVPGGYPLHRRSFIVSPAMVVGLVSPQAGSESDVAATVERHVPAALVEDIGPLIGWGGTEGAPVHLDAAQLYAGVSMTGLPGSGKSSLEHALWGWHCLERTSPSGKPGRPGASSSLIAIDPKPDGVPVWLAYSEATGDEVTVVSLADPSTPAIDLFAGPGKPEQRAGAFVEAMVYAWPAGDIQGRSYESLASVFEAAIVFESALGRFWSELALPGEADIVKAAHCLLGGHDDDSAVALAQAMAQALSGPDDPRSYSLRKLGPLFGRTVTPSQRRTATESARNKTKVLTEAASWWSPSRPKVTWDELVTSHRAVLLATGPTPEYDVSEKLTRHISAMATYALRGSIVRSCAGWQAAARSVSIFADELATVAVSSAEVVAWLRNQGRSYGVRTFFATQHAEQLSDEVRDAFLSSETLIAYRQGAVMAQRLAGLLASRADGWSASDLTGLDQHSAVLLTVAGGRPQPPTILRVGYWDDDPRRLAADQGYGRPSHAAASSTNGDSPPQEDDWLAAFRGR